MSVQIVKSINFYNYSINLYSKRDIIKIQIIINNDINKEYETSFKLKNLQSYKQLNSNKSIQEIVNFILQLIKNKNIEIKSNDESQLKLILCFQNQSNIELLIDKKEQKLIEYNQINSSLKLLKEKNIELEKKINLIISKYDKLEQNIQSNDCNKSFNFSLNNNDFNERLKHLEKENLEIKNGNKELKNEINKKEIKILLLNEKINKLEKRINILETKINKEKKKEYTNLYLVSTNNESKSYVNTVSIFPNGNIITGSIDKIINIYNSNLTTIIQKITNGHLNSILYIDIKDDNNFVSCSSDKNIITWIKKNNYFEINKILSPAHNHFVRKVLYFQNDKIISCSFDQTIKIWDENFKNLYKFEDTQKINSMLILKEENILVISGENNTKFFDLDNYVLKKELSGIVSKTQYSISRIDKNRIIIGGNDDMKIKIISIFNYKTIIDINNDFICWAILSIKNKEIFLVGGKSNIIKIYNSNNYECIQSINDAHSQGNIKGFNKLNNGNIISFSTDKTIKIWAF